MTHVKPALSDAAMDKLVAAFVAAIQDAVALSGDSEVVVRVNSYSDGLVVNYPEVRVRVNGGVMQ